MGVERQVVGHEADVRPQQHPQAVAPHADDARVIAAPRQSVVGDDQLRPGAIARSKSSRLADTPVATCSTSSHPCTCSPLGP